MIGRVVIELKVRKLLWDTVSFPRNIRREVESECRDETFSGSSQGHGSDLRAEHVQERRRILQEEFRLSHAGLLYVVVAALPGEVQARTEAALGGPRANLTGEKVHAKNHVALISALHDLGILSREQFHLGMPKIYMCSGKC